MKSEMKQNTGVTSSSDFTPNQTAVISNIHISERKLSTAVSSLILSPSQRRMQTLTQGKNLLMGHLLAAWRQALLSATACSRGVYMTKAVRRLMRQVSTSEINTPHIKQGKIKWTANSLEKENREASLPVRNSFSGLVNSWISVHSLIYLRYLKLFFLAPLKERASLTLEQPDVLSWNAFSFFMKQITHACKVVVKSKRESWEEGIFRSPALPTRTSSLKSNH